MSRMLASLLSPACLAALLVWLPADAQDKPGLPQVVGRLKGHGESVYTVAYSPDGKYLVTGSFDHTLKLWDVAAGKEIKTYGGKTGHQKMVLAVAFSPDGRMIASGGADNALKVWDVPVSTPLRSLPTGAPATAIALTPDGTKIAAGGKDGTIRLLTAADFKELSKLTGHQGAITGLSFSANGQLLASSGADRTVRFWNVAKGQLIAAVGAHAGAVNGVVVHPNNTAAYSVGDDGLLKFWQLPPVPAKVLPGPSAGIHALALSADGNVVLTAGADKTVRQFTIANAKEIRALTGAQAPVVSVALGAAAIAAGSEDRHVYLWNAADGKPAGRLLAHDGAVTGVQFPPQGTQLVTAGADGLVKQWALPSASPRAIVHPDGVLVALASADGKKLYTGSADKIVRVWDTVKPAIERQFAGHVGPVNALAVGANGQLLVSGGGDGTIRFWNQAMGKESDTLIAHGGAVTSLALNPAGNQLVSTGADGLVKLWQLPTVPPKAFIHPDQVTTVALSGDSAQLLTGAGDKVARLWNLANGAKQREYAGGPALPISALALSANGAIVAAAGLDKTLTLWDAATAKLRHKLPLAAVAQTLAFTPSSQQIAVGLADGTVKLLKVADGKEEKSLAAHKGAVTGLAFSAKGDVLYSAGADKAVQAWSLPSGTAKAKFDHDAPIAGIALSKDGTQVAVAGGTSVKVWNTADGKPIAAWNAPAESRGIALAPDKSRLLLAGADKIARLFEINGRLVESFAHDGPVQAVAFVDGKRIVTAADKTARLWTSTLLWQKPHDGPARRALFTPKGDQVVSGGDDKAIRVWNAADGKDVRTIAHPEGTIAQLAITADGARIAAAGSDKNVKLWTLADGKPVATIAVGYPVQALTLSPNGQRVAVSGADAKDTTIRVYDVALGRVLQQFADHAGPVTALAFQPDNRVLVSASLDKTARLLDASALTSVPVHAMGPMYVQLHSSGTQLLTGGADKTVKVWDLAKQAVLKTFGPLADPIRAVAYSKDYTQIAAAAGKVVKIWNLADGTELATLTHPADVLALSFNQDKARLATGSADKLTRLWEIATGRELQFFAQSDPVEAVAVTPAGAVVSAAGKDVHVETPSIVRLIAADAGPVYALAMLPANTHVLTGGADKTVKMWNLATGANDRSFVGAAAPVKAVALTKNSQLLAAAGADQTVRVYQLADAKEAAAVKTGGEVTTLAFTPNNLVLLAASRDKTMRAFGTPPLTPGQPNPPDFLQSVQSYSAAEPVQELVVAPDNATVYSAGLDSAVHVWKLASPTPTRNFPHPNNVDAVAFQPRGTLLASGGHDGKVRLFDLVKNVQVKEITAHVEKNTQSTVYSVAFSADGKQLVTCSLDNSLKLWDVAAAKLIREFKAHKLKAFEKGHLDPVYAAALSPDGKWLASGSGGLERVIKIWNVADGSVMRDLANPGIKKPAGQPATSHPGDVLHLHFTKDGKLISLGDAPKNRGYLGVWDPKDGKLLFGETLSLGTFFGLAVSPDEHILAVATGSRGKTNPNLNGVYLLKVPSLGK